VRDFLLKAKCPVPDRLLETTLHQTVTRAKRGWELLAEESSIGAFARFLASQAFIQRTYQAEDVLDTLSKCNLIGSASELPLLDFSTLTLEMCKQSLPAMAKNKYLWRSWNVFSRKTRAACFVQMQLDLVPHFIGKQGAAIKSMERDLVHIAKSANAADSRIRLSIETIEEEIDVRRFREEGKNVIETCEKVLRKEARVQVVVNSTEVLIGTAPSAKPACIVLEAASRSIRAHVNLLRSHQQRMQVKRRPKDGCVKATCNKVQGPLEVPSATCFLAAYTLRKENGRVKDGNEKCREWRSNKHFKGRPKPCSCENQWRGGRHKVSTMCSDDDLA
jgi:hypothetical protein